MSTLHLEAEVDAVAAVFPVGAVAVIPSQSDGKVESNRNYNRKLPPLLHSHMSCSSPAFEESASPASCSFVQNNHFERKMYMEEAYEEQKYAMKKYRQMERAILSSEIAGVDLRGAVTRGVGAQGIELSETVRRMEESIPQVIVLLEAAVERCISFTGGSVVDELILALDDIMLQMELKVHATLNLVSNEKECSIVQGALEILTVSDCLTSRSSVFEASLRATLARWSTSLSLSLFSSLDQNQSHVSDDGTGEQHLGGRAALDVAAVRLVDVPEKARKLFNLLSQIPDSMHFQLHLRESQHVHAFSIGIVKPLVFIGPVDELLLQEDGLDVSSMTNDFSKSMHLGSSKPLVGVGRFNPASSTSSILSVQRQNGPVQAFPHLEVGSPPSAHDPHSGFGRSMSKTSHFVPHISQNSPSRLGQQQPGQRFNYGRSTNVRIGESNHMKVQPPPASFNSGGPRSPGNSSFNNGMS
ncbi:hypothetical protein SO802_017223 [Lithocarpus litseifolius]|uniref:Conserved oligomeric Golgi complex subunit 7 n=1 Tax=Lithocarpus litseifolius TaxID=425828 RepID=A0AAW2CYN5_9ROSI